MRTIYIKLSYYIALLIVYGLYFDIKISSCSGKNNLRIHLIQI